MEHDHSLCRSIRSFLGQGLRYAARTVAGREAGGWWPGDDARNTPPSWSPKPAPGTAVSESARPPVAPLMRQAQAGIGPEPS